MISCSQFMVEFGSYLEGESAAFLRELEGHLALCRTCRVLVDSTAKTVRIVTEAGDFDFNEPLPEPVLSRIIEKIHADAGQREC